jgi:hypothetical protein
MKHLLILTLATLTLSAFAQIRRPQLLRVDPSAARRITSPGFLLDPVFTTEVNRKFIELARFGKLYCGGIEGTYVREGEDPPHSIFHVSDVGVCVDREGVTRHVSDRLSAYAIRELEMELQAIADRDEDRRRRENDSERDHWRRCPECYDVPTSSASGASLE